MTETPEAGTPEAGGFFGSDRELLIRIIGNQHHTHRKLEEIMAALDNLQAADTALKAEVTQAITDWAAQLAAAGSANDPAIQAVADDMNNVVSQLQAADTAGATPPPAQPPASGS